MRPSANTHITRSLSLSSTLHTYLEDISSLLVLHVRTDCGLEETEDGHRLLPSIPCLHVRIEQQLICLQGHVELDPVLLLGSVGVKQNNKYGTILTNPPRSHALCGQVYLLFAVCVEESFPKQKTVSFLCNRQDKACKWEGEGEREREREGGRGKEGGKEERGGREEERERD